MPFFNWGAILLLFMAGALTSALSTFAQAMTSGEGLQSALNAIESAPNEYILVFATSGAVWVVIGLILRAIKTPASPPEWIIYIGFVAIADGLALMFILNIVTSTFLAEETQSPTESIEVFFNSLTDPVHSIVAIVRSALLISIAVGRISVGDQDKKTLPDRWSASTLAGVDPHQVTRLLCGQAFLGDSSFRQRSLASSGIVGLRSRRNMGLTLICWLGSVILPSHARWHLHGVSLVFY